MEGRGFIQKKHIIIEILSYVLLMIAFILAIVAAVTTEGKIPTHYTLSGEIDGYGSAWTLLLMPIIMLITNGTVSVCLHLLPVSAWSTPQPVKPANSMRVYGDLAMMFVLLEIEISLFTVASTICSIQQKGGLELIAVFIMLAAVFATCGWGIWASIAHNK